MYQGFHWLSCAVAFAGCVSIGSLCSLRFLSSLVFSLSCAVAFLLAVYPLAPLCSLCFYHLWSSHGQRTPGFVSTKVLLLQIVNPRPVCSNNFPAVHSFLTFLLSQCLYLLGVRVWSCREKSGCTG